LCLPWQVGWTGLKSLYATVASTVESAAKEQGYRLDLGSKAVQQQLEQQRFQQQYGGGAYTSEGYGSGAYDRGGYGSGSQGPGGYGSNNSSSAMHKSASDGTGQFAGQHDSSGYDHQRGGPAPKQYNTSASNGHGVGSNGFAGFDAGGDDGEHVQE
jgi:hypothetical protein